MNNKESEKRLVGSQRRLSYFSKEKKWTNQFMVMTTSIFIRNSYPVISRIKDKLMCLISIVNRKHSYGSENFHTISSFMKINGMKFDLGRSFLGTKFT